MTTTVLAYFPSPAQGVWYLGPVPIRAYALCIIAGIIAALVIGDRRWVVDPHGGHHSLDPAGHVPGHGDRNGSFGDEVPGR